jgi:hypothetical protein
VDSAHKMWRKIIHCRRVSQLLFNSYVGVLDISSYTSTSTHSRRNTSAIWESNEHE